MGTDRQLDAMLGELGHALVTQMPTASESPIERLLEVALRYSPARARLLFSGWLFAGWPAPNLKEWDTRGRITGGVPVGWLGSWWLLQQASVAQYRVDFVVLHAEHIVIIECDGHAFHERTQAQARHDRKRDRFMLDAGFHVRRFTGSEICSDPNACAEEVLQLLMRLDPGLAEWLPALSKQETGASAGGNADLISAQDTMSLRVLGAILDYPELIDYPNVRGGLLYVAGDVPLCLGEVRRHLLGSDGAHHVAEFLAALPSSLQGFAAGRLASPVFDDIVQAGADLLDNLKKMRALARRLAAADAKAVLDRSPDDLDADGEVALRYLERLARDQRGLDAS